MKPSFQCPSCGLRFRVDSRYLGRRVRCPRNGCEQSIRLQASSQEPAVGDQPESSSTGASKIAASPAASGSENSATADVWQRSATSRQSRSQQRQQRMMRQISSSRHRTSRGWTRRGLAAAVVLITAVGVAAVLMPGSGFRLSASADPFGTGADDVPIDSALLEAGEVRTAAMIEADRRMKERQDRLDQHILPYFRTYCLDCHGPDLQEGGIRVDVIATPAEFLQDHRKWERVYRMMNAGAMPPADHEPLPPPDQQKRVLDMIYDEIFNFDCELVQHAGRPAVQRLNRAEYNNTIRDLFGITLTPADDFPQDDVGEGFDNIGDVLSVPPLLMEKYLDAAEAVAREVIDTRDLTDGLQLDFPAEKLRMGRDQGRPGIDNRGFATLSTTGRLAAEIELPADGEYRIVVEANATQAGDELARMALLMDGESLLEAEIPGHQQATTVEHTVELQAGKHRVAAAFLNDFYQPDAEDPKLRDRNMGVRHIRVSGPLNGDADLHHEVHRRLVRVAPSADVAVRQAAAQVMEDLLFRAFRRPATGEEIQRYAGLVDQVVTEYEESWEYGLFVAVQAVLVSPEFLFRLETEPASGDREEDQVLNDYEVASRLSYFLWSTMPDEELFDLAKAGQLRRAEVLSAQVERMLKDPRASALGDNFAAQWLNLRNLSLVEPNPELFPDFSDELRADMAEETLKFFNSLVAEDRPISDFLNADYTYINQRLAKHYGIPEVSGEEFVRVSLAGTRRAGVLTHASILTLTSNPGRTSPVKRGKWILENILAQAPPPAPAGVPALEESAEDVSDLTLREQLERHRADPGCAVCHITMDALGMGFENFDAIGQWRDEEAGKPVDASGDLPDGGHFSGAIELISLLEQQQDEFVKAFTEKLMTYALGRGLEYYDRCAVDRIVETARPQQHSFSALAKAIVLSDSFLKRSATREVVIPLAQQ